mmetsp:Transcript_33772/g.55754  ORF Transcript_33772/g.55754 Transcript_33772/m.55754 type:complete len:272 (+) Transcript_33772:253-1068(+)
MNEVPTVLEVDELRAHLLCHLRLVRLSKARHATHDQAGRFGSFDGRQHISAVIGTQLLHYGDPICRRHKVEVRQQHGPIGRHHVVGSDSRRENEVFESAHAHQDVFLQHGLHIARHLGPEEALVTLDFAGGVHWDHVFAYQALHICAILADICQDDRPAPAHAVKDRLRRGQPENLHELAQIISAGRECAGASRWVARLAMTTQVNDNHTAYRSKRLGVSCIILGAVRSRSVHHYESREVRLASVRVMHEKAINHLCTLVFGDIGSLFLSH